MSDDFSHQEDWKDHEGDEMAEDEEWLTHHLGEEIVEKLQRVRIRYEFINLDQLIFASLLLVTLIEEEENKGKRIATFEYKENTDGNNPSKTRSIQGTITSLEELLDLAERSISK